MFDFKPSITIQLMAFARRRGGRVTVREVTRGFSCFRRAEDAKRVMNVLVGHGLAEWKFSSPNSRGGRPKSLFVLKDAEASSPKGKLKAVSDAGLAVALAVMSSGPFTLELVDLVNQYLEAYPNQSIKRIGEIFSLFGTQLLAANTPPIPPR